MSIPQIPGSTTAKYIAGSAITIVGIVGYVFLALYPLGDAANARGALLIVITPITTALFISGAVEGRITNLEQKTDKVVSQTNGDLTEQSRAAAVDAARIGAGIALRAHEPTQPRGVHPRNIVRGEE